MAFNPYDDRMSNDLYRRYFSIYGDAQNSGKYDQVAGLSNCPKCDEQISDDDYCHECDYGKDKYEDDKKPKKIDGYNYVVNHEFPRGRYFKVSDKSLFETVIIEDYKKQMIVETLSLVQNRDLIFNKWGFKDTIEKGTGVSLLFYGIPGTGKTLMAEAIAQYLGKKLKIITAAEVLDKYVGETEKKIAEVFDTHKEDVILFDECDSLLGSRERARASWEVSQVNVLLNKLENHLGVVIFTTNHETNLDKALDRRIAAKIKFEMPDEKLREKIWRRMFPEKAPLDKDIDWNLLSKYEITGGYIKNAVLRAARISAFQNDKTITFQVIKRALKQELEAMLQYEDTMYNSNEEIKEQTKAMEAQP